LKRQLSEREFRDDGVCNEFYSDSTVIGTVKYVQHPDVDLDNWNNVTKIDFFKTTDRQLITTSYKEGMDTTGFVQFQIENASWLNLKYQVFSDIHIIEPVRLLLDTAAFKDARSLQELLILQEIFNAAGISYEFCYRKIFIVIIFALNYWKYSTNIGSHLLSESCGFMKIRTSIPTLLNYHKERSVSTW
jgi:hypothetical protein